MLISSAELKLKMFKFILSLPTTSTNFSSQFQKYHKRNAKYYREQAFPAHNHPA